MSFTSWESELIACGRIVQDDDDSVSNEEAERRFDRYLELIESLNGSEGVDAARALVRSIQANEDYGAYQHTLSKLVFDFPPRAVGEAVVAELPRLIAELPDRAGELLNFMLLAEGISSDLITAFNVELAQTSAADQELIVGFVRQEESVGWLREKVGLLAV